MPNFTANLLRAPVGLVAVALVVLAGPAPAQSRVKQGARGDRSAFTAAPEKREPIRKQDLVLILVQEEARGDVGAGLDSRRKTELNASMDSFAAFKDFLAFNDGTASTRIAPEVKFEGEAKTKGSGKTNRKDSIRARITARVIDVLDNGNIRLEARRERRINDELTIITLSGEARAADVSLDNQILSDRLADLKLTYGGQGTVSNRTGQSWLGWLADWLWPF